MEIDVFSGLMRNEFITALDAPDTPVMDCIGIINSTSRIENYSFMTPTPGMQQYVGFRNLASIGLVKYSKENLEFAAGIQVLARDVRDNMVGGYPLRFQGLAKKARQYPNILSMQTLNNGATTLCFDGSYFFADSHNIGTGDNLMSGSGDANNDGLLYKVVLLIKSGEIKPLLWQDFMKPKLADNTATFDADFTKELRYIVDMEGNIGFGYWWDAIEFTWTDQPTLTQLQTMAGDMESQIRGFKFPKAFSADASEFPHAQLDLNPSTASWLCSTALASKMEKVLNAETIVESGAAVTNIHRGKGKLVVCPYLNPASLL